MTTTEQETVEDVELDEHNEFDRFESWVMGLGEESAIQSQDPDEQTTAIQQLQELVSQAFPAGVDGSNAVESLKGIIDDPQLEKQIQTQAAQDPEMDARGLVQQWLSLYAPEVLEQLDFGDFDPNAQAAEEPVAADPAPEEVPQESADGPNKSDVPAYLRKQKGEEPMTLKDLEDEKTKSPTSSAGLARRKQELGMGEADNEPGEKDDDPPFDPDEKPSTPVTPGKHCQEYSK